MCQDALSAAIIQDGPHVIWKAEGYYLEGIARFLE